MHIASVGVDLWPRLQQFPRGLGKGFDAALMGKWLREVFAGLTPDMVPAACCARNPMPVALVGMMYFAHGPVNPRTEHETFLRS